MRNYGQFCALARALDHVGHRWTLLIIRELLLGPSRFTDLRSSLPGIATNLLTDRLRALQDDGLVRQRGLPPPAASTVYELTDAGEELREVVHGLIRWGGRWMPAGIGDDHFDPAWLALALEALGVGERAGDIDIDLEVDRTKIELEIREGRIRRRLDATARPAFTIRADALVILGLAAGALPADSIGEAMSIEPDTPPTPRQALTILVPA
jgi:DNA-binding HxlR family transcriptional regulator